MKREGCSSARGKGDTPAVHHQHIERELMQGVRMIRRNMDKESEEQKGVIDDVFGF